MLFYYRLISFVCVFFFVFFFFSSRRRHTRCSRDWSSDVCSSDLDGKATLLGVVENMVGGPFVGSAADELAAEFGIPVLARVPFHPGEDVWENEIGRASCRERV